MGHITSPPTDMSATTDYKASSTPAMDAPHLDLENKQSTIDHVEDSQQLDKTGHYANQIEHEETALGALRNHKWANLWIIYAIWVLVACSFDNNASSSILGIPQFRQDFGSAYAGSYVLPAKWQSAYSGGPAAATVVGAFASGWIVDRIGRKFLIGGCYLIVMVGITVEIIANNAADPNAVFFAGKFINGLAIGGLISTIMSYVGELAPTALRGVWTAACRFQRDESKVSADRNRRIGVHYRTIHAGIHPERLRRAGELLGVQEFFRSAIR